MLSTYFFSINNVHCLLMSITTTIPTRLIGLVMISLNNFFIRETRLGAITIREFILPGGLVKKSPDSQDLQEVPVKGILY